MEKDACSDYTIKDTECMQGHYARHVGSCKRVKVASIAMLGRNVMAFLCQFKEIEFSSQQLKQLEISNISIGDE